MHRWQEATSALSQKECAWLGTGELTAPETAERLAISIDAVKSRLHRARAMMRERLLASGYLGSESSL